MHSGRTGGNPAPVLDLGQRVLNLMAHVVEPLSVRDSPVAMPPARNAGGDALPCQHGADLVAVIALPSTGGHQGSRTWQVPRQDSTGAVAALPCAQTKPHRPPILVMDHGSLAGHAPLVPPIKRGAVPLVEAGRRAMCFEGRGIDHPHLLCCLCAVGSCQPGEEQLETPLSHRRRQRL